MIIIMTTFVVGLHVHVEILLESLLDHVALTKAGVPQSRVGLARYKLGILESMVIE